MKKLFMSILFAFFVNNQALSQIEGANFNDSVLSIPVVNVGEKNYSAQLKMINSDPLEFSLTSANKLSAENKQSSATFTNDILSLSLVHVGAIDYSAKLDLINDQPLTFRLTSAQIITSSSPNLGNNSSIVTFDELDTSISQKTVSTDSIDGLWLVYGHGKSSKNVPSVGVTIENTVKLFASVVSIREVFKNGQYKLSMESCSENQAILSPYEIDYDHAGKTFNMSYSDLNLSGFIGLELLYLIPGDTLVSNYWDINSEVKVIDNKEMVFTSEYNFVDSTGDATGNFSSIYKARKINDSAVVDPGNIVVNGIKRPFHCYEYLNTDSIAKDSHLSNHSNTENFRVISKPPIMPNTSLLENSFVVIVFLNKTNKNEAIPNETNMSMTFTSDSEKLKLSARSFMPNDIIDFHKQINSGLNTLFDYKLYDDSIPDTTLTGTIEVDL